MNYDYWIVALHFTLSTLTTNKNILPTLIYIYTYGHGMARMSAPDLVANTKEVFNFLFNHVRRCDRIKSDCWQG